VSIAGSKGNIYRAEITIYSFDEGVGEDEEQNEEWLPEYVILPNA